MASSISSSSSSSSSLSSTMNSKPLVHFHNRRSSAPSIVDSVTISGMAASSSSGSLSSTMNSKLVVHFHNRRSSVPSIVDTIMISGIAASSSGSSSQLARERRVQSLPSSSLPHVHPILPTPPSPPEFSSSRVSIVYSSTPNDDLYTITDYYKYTPYGSSNKTVSVPALQSQTNFLKAPSSKTRVRSKSLPLNPVLIHGNFDGRTDGVLTSSSSSSSSHEMISGVRKQVDCHSIQSKENKSKERRLSRSRDKTLLCYSDMQMAENFIKSGKTENYQNAIMLYRQVIKNQNMDKVPWVKPYFRLVELLLRTTNHKNKEILEILDSIIKGRFNGKEKAAAYDKKGNILAMSQECDAIVQAEACWAQANVLRTSAAKQTRKEMHLNDSPSSGMETTNDKGEEVLEF